MKFKDTNHVGVCKLDHIEDHNREIKRSPHYTPSLAPIQALLPVRLFASRFVVHGPKRMLHSPVHFRAGFLSGPDVVIVHLPTGVAFHCDLPLRHILLSDRMLKHRRQQIIPTRRQGTPCCDA